MAKSSLKLMDLALYFDLSMDPCLLLALKVDSAYCYSFLVIFWRIGKGRSNNLRLGNAV